VKSNLIFFFLGFGKTTQISNFMKIRPMGAELFHEEGRTDRQTHRHDKAYSRFSNFCERPKQQKKKGIIIFLTSAPIRVSCRMKAQRNQDSGSIMPGANTKGGAIMLRPIRFQCAGVRISAGHFR